MAFEEFKGELDAPAGVAFVPFSGELDAPGKPPARKPRGEIDYGNAQGFSANEIMDMPIKAGGMGSVLESRAADRPESPLTLDQLRAMEKQSASRGGAQTAKSSSGPDRVSDATYRGAALQDASLPVRAVFKAVSGVAQGAGGLIRGAGDLVGSTTLQRAGAETTKGAEEFQRGMGETGAVEGFGPKSPVPYLSDMGEGAASSLGQSAAYAGMFGAKAVIPLMAVMSAGEQYDKARTQGLDPAMALAGALPKGAFEAIGEKFSGLDKVAGAMGTILTKGASAEAKKGAAEILIKSGVKEIPGEIITYVGQTGVDLLPGIGLNPNLTMSQFVDGLRDTVVQAGMMGGAMGVGGVALGGNATTSRPVATGEKYPASPDTLPGVPPAQPPVNALLEIDKAQTVDQAIEAAARAVQSSTAVDNIGQILEQNRSPAQTTQAITELETANVSRDPAVQPMDTGTAGGGMSGTPDGMGVQPGASPVGDVPLVDVGRGGAGENGAQPVEQGSVPNRADAGLVPLEPGAKLDAVDQRLVPMSKRAATPVAQPNSNQALDARAQAAINSVAHTGENNTQTATPNVQNQSAPTTQTEAAPSQTPAPSGSAGVEPAAAGTPAGNAAVQTARVDQRLVPMSKRAAPATVESVAVTGEQLDKQWTAFAPESGTLSVPRADMPQIKAEHRGAMVNFLNARDIAHTQEEVPAASLKPTQMEFSPAKVAKAMGFTGTDRSILVSSDNHVLDGHHQWMAKLEAGEPVKVIRLDAPIKQLLEAVKEFPSAEQAAGTSAPAPQRTARQVAIDAERARIEAKRVEKKAARAEASKAAPGLTVGVMPNSAEPVTIKDGVVYIGKYAATNFETGDDVTVPAGATDQQIRQALTSSGALGKKARIFGASNQMPAQSTPASIAIENVAPVGTETPDPVQQRADFAAAEKKRKAPGIAARERTNTANPFKGFLGKHGISNSLASEFAPGRKERQAAMVQGYGPIFRKSGPQLDALAARAVEEGFLLEPDEAKLQALILDALRGKRIIAQYAEGVAEDEMQDRMAAYEEAARQIPDDVLEELDGDIPAFSSASNTSTEDAMRALGFTDQEITDAIANESQSQGQGGESRGQTDEGTTGPAQSRGEAGNAAPRDDAEGLTAPTQQEVLDQQDRKDNADSLDQREQIDREASGQTLTSQTAPEQRTDTSGDMFAAESDAATQSELGNLSRAQLAAVEFFADATPESHRTEAARITKVAAGLTKLPDIKRRYEALAESHRLAADRKEGGQGSMFDEPAAEPAKAEKPASEMSAAELLRAAADKMDAAEKAPAGKVEAEQALWKRINEGEATLGEFKTGFEAWVSDKTVIVAELLTKKKDDLLKMGGPYFTQRYKSEIKADIAESLWRDGMGTYALGKSVSYSMGQDSYQTAVRRQVEATDAAELAQHAKDIAAAKEERAQQTEAKAKAIENPKTLGDYESLINARAREAGVKTMREALMLLTPDQRAAYDNLATEKSRGARKDQKEDRQSVRVAGQQVDGEIIETKHTQKGHDLFVVQLAERVSREDYETLSTSAKSMGGYYSSFRGRGAVAGFQFRDRFTAEAFVKLANGDTSEAQQAVDARRDAFTDDRSQTAVERLREMADRLEDRADESLAVERKANTDRRARFASNAEAAASSDKALAKTMRNIAQAISDGKANMLDRVRAKAQVEMLAGFVKTAKDTELRAKYPSYAEWEKRKGEPATAETAGYAEFPAFTVFRSDLASLARQLLEVDGTKKIGTQLMKVADDVSDAFTKFAKEPGNLFKLSAFSVKAGEDVRTAIFPDRDSAERAIKRSGLSGKAIVFQEKRGVNRIILSPSEAMNRGIWTGDGDKRITLTRDFGQELVQAIGRRANKTNRLTIPWQFETASDRLKALARIGIETPAELRTALREFIGLQERAQEADRVKVLERAMVGRKKDGLDFFPTPQGVADEMVEAADIKPGMTVLEPSGGMGHIAERIRDAGVEPDVAEISADRRELLQAKGFNVVADDFLTMDGQYDRIVMNPPFSDRRDAEHVKHAYTLLKPSGRVVAIMGEGVFFGQDKKAEDFRAWLEKVGGTDEKLAEGAFMDPTLPVNTGVNARMVVIERTGSADIQFSRAESPSDPMGELDDLFALPKSKAKTVEAITAENDPDIEVKRGKDMAGSDEYTFTMKDGSQATMTVRKPNPYGPSVYAMDLNNGDGTADVERPGENPEDVPADMEDVYINVSSLKTGASGNKIYNIAATYAHNNGKIFIGDPAGLSDEALRRRTEQMISSALKFGTTEHLGPHPRQATGDRKLGVPPLQWVYGDDEGNISRMIDVSIKATENVFPTAKNLSYDNDTGTFRNAITGRPVPFGELAERVGKPLARARGVVGSGAGAAQAGWRTVARNALYRSIREAASNDAGGAGRGGILDWASQYGARFSIDGRTGRAYPPKDRIFYSEDRPAQPAAVRNPSTVELVQAAVAELIGGKQLPNKLGRVVATTAAEIKSRWEPILGQNLQIGSEGDAGVAQGFYDPVTKSVFLIADHIEQGNEMAVAAHELMHKHGQTVLGKDGWDKLHTVINTWENAEAGSDERAVYNYARSKVEAVGMELSSQEMFPYAVEAALKMGVKPSLIAKQGTVARWLGSVKYAMQQAWGKVTGKPETFKTQDLVDLSFGIAQMENPESAAVMGRITDALVKTDSPEFRKWFGDSKVVDDSGKPLVVYHGTNGDFQAFDGPAFFTDSSDEAAEYGGTVMPAYVRITNPKRLDSFDQAKALQDDEIARYAKLGYDGFIGEGAGGTHYVAFTPEQIKSAIGNNGDFDSTNPDIRFSRNPIATTAQQPIATANQPTPVKPTLNPWRDETGRMQFAPGQWLYDQIGKAASPMLVRLGMKAATPELRRQLRQMKIDVEKAQDVAVAIAKETTKLSEEERAMVSDLVEKELKVGVIPPAHAIKLAAMINDAMGRQTDELVSLGMLTKDSADKWRGQYLPRYYESKLRDKLNKAGATWADALMGLTGRQSVMKGIKGKNLKGRGLYETIPEAELPNYEALGWEVRDPDYTPSLPSVDGTVQVWRDFSPAEREKMGEIRDAGFRFVMGYMQTQRDIALGRMFERMAQDPDSSSRLEKEGYVQVPTTTVSGTGAKVYGKLAGRWVPRETMSQLSNIEESSSAAWQMYRKALGIWKLGKTAMNPVSHVNNIVSNLTMAHLAGVSYMRGDKYIAAARDFAKKSAMVQEAKDNGLFLGTISDTELMNSMPEELRLLAQKQESTTLKVARTGFDILTMFLRKPMGAAYQAEDTFFRYLIYKDARDRGTEPQDAVDYAQRYIFTYDDLPKGARMVRDFGIPFFSYTYKAVPALLHTALTHPLRMAAPAAVLWGINAAAYAIATGDDDDEWQDSIKKYLTDPEYRAKAKEKEKLEREFLPSWNKGTTSMMTPKMVRLGMDEVTKLPLFIDVSRIIPGGDMFDVSPNAGGIPLPQPITPSNPLFTTAVAMLGNKDLFRGKDLVDKNDTTGEAAEKRLGWLWTQLSPAVAAGNYHWQRGMNALAQANGGEVKWVPDMLGGDATGIGKDGLPVQPKFAAMQTFGIKVRPMDLETSAAMDRSMQNKMVRDIDTELKALKRLESKGAVAPRTVDKARELADMKKERLKQGLTVDGKERD